MEVLGLCRPYILLDKEDREILGKLAEPVSHALAAILQDDAPIETNDPHESNSSRSVASNYRVGRTVLSRSPRDSYHSA